MDSSRPEFESSLVENQEVRPAPVTRRGFIAQTTALLAVAGGIPRQAEASGPKITTGAAAGSKPPDSFLDLLRQPDSVTAYSAPTEPLRLAKAGAEWGGSGVSVGVTVEAAALVVTIAAPRTPLRRVHLRWRMAVGEHLLVLGDAWERSYGDLGWRNLVPERVLPWYFATYDGHATHAYGVKTQAGALCFWQVDREGVSLWLDVSNGGSGVELSSRTLRAATVVCRLGQGEDGPAALSAFCRQMCAVPPLPAPPIYGFNDWYYAYGRNTAQQILADTDFLASLTGASGPGSPSALGGAGGAGSGRSPDHVRAFSVVDDGWQDPQRFPDMGALAGQIKARGVRPGLWIRPLEAPAGTDRRLLLPDARYGPRRERFAELAYDPTLPEARELVLAKVTQAVSWGYDLVKHDFSTYELLGQWGFEMGAAPTQPGWALYDRSRTNAEVMLDLYRGIRSRCAPETLVLGCNAVGHLGQGLFDAQRTGDDTSGRVWERTRRMGINTLAFRLPQHGAFFVQDADCVGIAPSIAWEQNRQWLDLLARSGTALFVSPGEGARGAEQAAAISGAFAIAAAGGAQAQPADWLTGSAPEEWTSVRGALRYHWCDSEGAWPFTV